MGLFVFGTRKIPIGVDELLVRCPSCEGETWADVLVWGNCFHIYWLPIVSVDKEADIICKRCGLKRYGRSFDATLLSNFDAIKSRFRHPLVAYTGGGLLLVLFLLIAFVHLLR